MQEFIVENLHWIDHAQESIIMMLIIISIIIISNVVFGNGLNAEIDYAIKNPREVFLINLTVFVLLAVISHFIVLNTGVDIWGRKVDNHVTIETILNTDNRDTVGSGM